MSAASTLIKMLAASDISWEDSPDIAAAAMKAMERARKAYLAKEMTEAQWRTAVKKAQSDLDAWLVSSNKTEDDELEGKR